MPKIKKYPTKWGEKTLPELIEITNSNVKYQTIASRIRRGVDVEEAVTKETALSLKPHPTSEFNNLCDKPRTVEL
jgi:hypothetical protein